MIIEMMIIENLKVNSMTKSVITVDRATEEEKEIAQHMAKNAINVVEKNHFKTVCKSSDSKSESKCDSRRLDGTKRRNINELEFQDDMEDLTEQVQSLFYA